MNGERSLLDDKSQWYTFAEALPQIVWATRRDGYHVYFNQRWYDHTGLTREQSIGSGWSAAFHPDDKASSLASWKQAIETQASYEAEHRLRAADGCYRWFLTQAIPRRDQLGVIVCWLGICTSIDEQKKAQEEARHSEERFRLLAEAIPQKVWITDHHGSVRYLNQCWFDYTGLTYEQANGWGWLQAVHPADRQAGTAYWARTVEQGGQVKIEQRLRQGFDGAFRWHLVRGIPLRDETGAIVQWIGTATDVDDQRRQTELLDRLVLERTSELRRSNRQLEEFASLAAHDLQEPLRKIQAFADRLQAKCGHSLSKQGKEYLQRILNSATRMRNLIIDVLKFSYISANTQTFVPVNLEAAAREVISDLEGLIQQTSGTVEVGPLPTIHADPLQIRRLLQNLIGNGLKFQHPDRSPVVKLSARALPIPEIAPSQTWYEIAVADNGIGFEDIHLDRIFQMFQRLHGSKEYEGTGIGLAICRKIVERHQGRITARSTPGQGATFLVTLPAHPRQEDLAPHDN
jgi:PAS domain S-box-containing protein